MAKKAISINRAPVLTLSASVVAGRAGFDNGEALTLGRAVAGLDAYSKGRCLGLFKPAEEKVRNAREKEPGTTFKIDICGRTVPARITAGGM